MRTQSALFPRVPNTSISQSIEQKMGERNHAKADAKEQIHRVCSGEFMSRKQQASDWVF
jgi:hypothetical protein